MPASQCLLGVVALRLAERRPRVEPPSGPVSTPSPGVEANVARPRLRHVRTLRFSLGIPALARLFTCCAPRPIRDFTQGKAGRQFELLRIPSAELGLSRRRPLVLQVLRRGSCPCARAARPFADIARCRGRPITSSTGLPDWQSALESLRLSKSQHAGANWEHWNCCASPAQGKAKRVDFSLHLHVSGHPCVSSKSGGSNTARGG